MTEPVKCPKCGAVPDIERNYAWTVWCDDCAQENDGVAEVFGGHLHDKGLAIVDWNTKAGREVSDG